ncbi:hypothetical protein SE17_01135 [Kouleothrix aurantiaca]|uniref:Phage terminase large subunit GpA ATPase domain-containing protein n=1 Tax=Kouleothrix aurantiaca TaxID=186479 RepID=A0A0N8PT88_9CHLR|nr:hypothetical protein SE17_01135 [Kouleothrix aurantiaca]
MKERGISVPERRPGARKRVIPLEDRSLNALAWAEKYRRIDGKAFSLDRHLPLKQVYEDDHPHIVIMKCAQVGASEMAVTKTLHAMDVGAHYWKTDKDGLNVAYLFPTGRALSDFSKERLSSTIGEHPHIEEMFKGGFNDVTFKQAGSSYLYLRSAYIPAGGKKNTAAEQLLSFPADVLMLDEFDRMSSAAVSMVEKRLRASVVGRQYNISTPTLPGVGVHGVYLLSDQQVWQVPCPCGAWVEMDFFRDVFGWSEGGRGAPAPHGWHPHQVWSQWTREEVAQARWSVRCPSCKNELNRFAPGRWIAQRPEVESVRGYHLPALAFPAVQLDKLAKAAASTDPTHVEEFFRSDLGLPYEADGSTITMAMINALPAPPGLAPRMGYTMGVDVGAHFHYRISSGGMGENGQRTIVAMGSVPSWEALDALFTTYPILRCVIDAQPELNATKDFADRHKGKVLRAYYADDRSLKGELFRLKEDEGIVSINRTMAMDRFFARVQAASDFWPKTITENSEVRQHLCAPSRTSIVNEKTGDVTAQWVHTAPDHLFHASVYDQMASLTRMPDRASAFVQGSARGWSPT